jgi:peptidoglycan hydrolase CwlO-like protein
MGINPRYNQEPEEEPQEVRRPRRELPSFPQDTEMDDPFGGKPKRSRNSSNEGFMTTWGKPLLAALVIGVIFALVMSSGMTGLVTKSYDAKNWTDNTTALQQIKSQLTNVQKNIDTAMTNVNNAINQVDEKVNLSVSSGLAQVNSELSGYSSKIDKLQAKITDMQGQLNTLQGQVGSVSSMQTAITDMQGKVNTLTSQISTLQTSINTANSKIATLETKVAALETAATTTAPPPTTITTTVSSDVYIIAEPFTTITLKNPDYTSPLYLRIYNNTDVDIWGGQIIFWAKFNNLSYGTLTLTADAITWQPQVIQGNGVYCVGDYTGYIPAHSTAVAMIEVTIFPTVSTDIMMNISNTVITGYTSF